jgi:hypothetical protein
MRLFHILSATGLFLMTTPAAGQWVSRTSEYTCSFKQRFGSTELAFGVSREHDYGSVILWNGDWKSIEDGKLYVINILADGLEVGPYQAKGMRTTSGSTGLYLSIDGKTKFRALSRANILEFRASRKLVGRFSLAGAASAMDSAFACVAAGDGADPFRP